MFHTKVSFLQAQARTDLSILLEKTYKEMQLYLDEYQALNSSLSLANENVRLRERSFMEGLSTSIDVIDAQLFLAATKTERLNAAYNYVQKLSHLMVLSGERENFITLEQNAKAVQG
ncbi:MAG TPA: TolC family protein [Helicobacteraceae bacterium]|nr:TolC family protein [Helicobacteraceae bacterium]